MNKRVFFGYFVVVALLITPIWLVRYFPSQDGPIHLEIAKILREHNNPEFSLFKQYYVINNNVEPTWLGHLILAGLMSLFPVVYSEKLYLSGYIILFLLSFRYTLSQIRADSNFLMLMIFPLAYNYLFHSGFYDFSYSCAIYIFILGYWLKYAGNFNPRRTLLLMFLFLLLYFFHIFSLALAILSLGILLFWFSLVDSKNIAYPHDLNISLFWQKFKKRAAPVLLAVLPATLLSLIFMFRMASQGEKMAINLKFSRRISTFRPYYILVSYDKAELVLAMMLTGLFLLVFFHYLASLIKTRRTERRDGMGLVFLALFVLYFIAPENLFGGGRSLDRIMLFMFIVLVFLFAYIPHGPIIKRIVVVGSSLITLIFLLVISAKYVEINRSLKEYLSGMQLIRKNSTLLPISFSQRGDNPEGKRISMRVSPFLHASGYIAAERGIVNFSNYSADLKYFPLIFNPDFNPYLQVGDIDSENIEGIDILSFPKRTGGNIDYVLLWGINEGSKGLKASDFINSQLEKNYKLIYESKGKHMQLYQRLTLKR